MRFRLISAILFISIPSFSNTMPNELPGWDAKSPAQKNYELQYSLWRREERFASLVIGCLQTYDNRERNYNDQWHRELETKAVQCALHLESLIDKIDKVGTK